MNKNKGCLIIAIFAFLLLSCRTNENPNCAKLKNGKYYYYTKKTREKTFVERTDSLQTESNESGKNISKNKIAWKGNCQFDMYLNAFSDSTLNETDSIIAATPAHIEIIYIGDTFYICTAKMNIFNKNLDFTDTLYFRN